MHNRALVAGNRTFLLLTFLLALPLALCSLCYLACQTCLRCSAQILYRLIIWSFLALLFFAACLVVSAYFIATFVSINPNLQ